MNGRPQPGRHLYGWIDSFRNSWAVAKPGRVSEMIYYLFLSLTSRLLGFWRRLYDRPLAAPTAREVMLVENFRFALQEDPTPRSPDLSPSEKAWTEFGKRLRDLVMGDDPRRFLRWDVIRKTMFVGSSLYVARELKYLKRRPDWESRWKPVLREDSCGHPKPYFLYPASSANLIHHAYHLCQMEEKTGLSIDQVNLVVEFGGGYGGMCRLVHRFGFKGTHVIYDLPTFSALQQFYLQSLGLTPVRTAPFAGHENGPGAILASATNDIRQLLSSMAPTRSAFIATWSLSEAPVPVRQEILNLVSGFDLFLIAYQERFGEVDNRQFFEGWKPALADRVDWQEWEIEHLPGSRYLIGSARIGR